jgi:predicted RNA polymerase sigma factor
MRLAPSPVVALSRAVAVGQAEGPQRGIDQLQALEGSAALAQYPFYQAALGSLCAELGRTEAARTHYRAALELARSPMERRFYERRLAAL